MNQITSIDQTTYKPVLSLVSYAHEGKAICLSLDLSTQLDSEKLIKVLRWAALHAVSITVNSSRNPRPE